MGPGTLLAGYAAIAAASFIFQVRSHAREASRIEWGVGDTFKALVISLGWLHVFFAWIMVWLMAGIVILLVILRPKLPDGPIKRMRAWFRLRWAS